MNKLELDKIINNYQYELDFFESPEEYLIHHNVPNDKIKMSCFKIKVMLHKIDRELKSLELEKTFNNCTSFQATSINKERFVIMHPCTYKGYKYQLSYFDAKGAIMDEKSETLEEVIYNFYKICKEYKIIKVVA